MFNFIFKTKYLFFALSFLLFTYSYAEKKKDVSNIVFCWSPDDHPKHTHGYKLFAKIMEGKFKSVEDVKTTSVQGFPKAEIWKDADLVIFFLTVKTLSEEQLELLDKHIANGKSLFVMHQGLVVRKNYDGWADRIGFAYSWTKGEQKSNWGAFNSPINLNTEHEIFKGFDKTITFKDELYWNLKKGSRGKITVLGTTQSPKEPKGEWPAFWTVEHNKTSRVFCTVPGHFDKVISSEIFEKTLFRGMAWCLSRPINSFDNLPYKK